MRYALLVKPHANVRYRQSLQKLALLELECMLHAWEIDADARMESLGGEPFLVFDADAVTEDAWQAISRHSAICFAAEVRQGALYPIARDLAAYLPEDLSQVLKYKGKTNADFTQMMLHCAMAASAFVKQTEPLCVLDPLCGKATSLFCALQEGHNAIGVEVNAKALSEADVYFSRFLKLHKVKHKRETGNQTLRGGGSVRQVVYTVSQSAEHMKQGDTRTLTLLNGDATRLCDMVRPGSVHVAISDLPYGVQHAPKEFGNVSSLSKLLDAVARGCAGVLKKGGAVALAFNQNTLRRSDVSAALSNAGLSVKEAEPYADFSHWVEQAVLRDMVVATKN